LKKVKVIKFDEQPDLSSVVGEAKLFTYPDRMEFMINIAGHATHIVSLSLPDMKLTEKFIEYADIVPASEKKKWYINSFQKDGNIFSLLLNKKEIRVSVHNQASGKLLNQYLLTNDSGMELLAQQPVREIRFGKKTNEKEMDIKKLIKEFTKGTEGLMVSKNKAGQLILTVGTYDLTPLSSGGTSGGWERITVPGTGGSHPGWNTTMNHRPGTPSYTTTSARYYTSAYCKLLLDPVTLKVTRGKVPTPEADQIKDYIDGVSSKAKATNQFSLGAEQFYGYYDRDEKAYVVDLIRIIQ
jgi:hypothetical protein